MPNTDFFDDDLVKQRDAARKIKLPLGDEPLGTVGDIPAGEEVPVRPLSDFNLTRMAKHKHEVNDQVVQAMEELERLRKRQEDLEREKQELEDLRRKQEEYERGKREMIERFTQSLVTLEKDELQAERMGELLGATRKRFKNMLNEIQSIAEEGWPEETIRDELNKALTLIEDARMEFNKAMSRIEGAGGEKQAPAHHAAALQEGLPYREPDRSFGYWLKAGIAITLPLIIVILAVAAVYFLLRSNGLI